MIFWEVSMLNTEAACPISLYDFGLSTTVQYIFIMLWKGITNSQKIYDNLIPIEQTCIYRYYTQCKSNKYLFKCFMLFKIFYFS